MVLEESLNQTGKCYYHFFLKKGPFVIPFSCTTPPGQPPPLLPTEPPILPNPELTDPLIARPAWCVYHPQKKKKKETKSSCTHDICSTTTGWAITYGPSTSEAAGGIMEYLAL